LRSRRSHFRILRSIGYLTLSVTPWLCTNGPLAATEVVRDYYQMICLTAFNVVALVLQIFSSTRRSPAEIRDHPVLAPADAGGKPGGQGASDQDAA